MFLLKMQDYARFVYREEDACCRNEDSRATNHYVTSSVKVEVGKSAKVGKSDVFATLVVGGFGEELQNHEKHSGRKKSPFRPKSCISYRLY